MKNIKLTVLLAASFTLWNCTESTQPESNVSSNTSIPTAVNALTKITALHAGMVPVVSDSSSIQPVPFSPNTLAQFKEAGLCQGFIDLYEELTTNQSTLDSGQIPPRLQQVITCFSGKVSDSKSEIQDAAIFRSAIEECFCNGTGSLFRNYSFSLEKYSAPKTGGSYNPPAASSSTYSSPSVSADEYSAPKGPASEGYSAPGL